jgi:hypothetical protein
MDKVKKTDPSNKAPSSKTFGDELLKCSQTLPQDIFETQFFCL